MVFESTSASRPVAPARRCSRDWGDSRNTRLIANRAEPLQKRKAGLPFKPCHFPGVRQRGGEGHRARSRGWAAIGSSRSRSAASGPSGCKREKRPNDTRPNFRIFGRNEKTLQNDGLSYSGCPIRLSRPPSNRGAAEASQSSLARSAVDTPSRTGAGSLRRGRRWQR